MYECIKYLLVLVFYEELFSFYDINVLIEIKIFWVKLEEEVLC